jgi:imidazolonepropionase-like amidohydrolase
LTSNWSWAYSIGTLEIGKRADMVLLGSNPLDDIANVKKVNGVLFGEKWLNREDIQSRLDDLYH